MISLVMLIILLGIEDQAHAQVCSWNFTQPAGVTVYQPEVRVNVIFNVSVSGEVLTNADRITWKANETDISLRRYYDGKLTELANQPRGNASSGPGWHSIIIPQVYLNDSGLRISVISGGCTVDDVSPVITLLVEDPESLSTTEPTTVGTTNTSPISLALTTSAGSTAASTSLRGITSTGISNRSVFHPNDTVATTQTISIDNEVNTDGTVSPDVTEESEPNDVAAGTATNNAITDKSEASTRKATDQDGSVSTTQLDIVDVGDNSVDEMGSTAPAKTTTVATGTTTAGGSSAIPNGRLWCLVLAITLLTRP